MLFVRQTPRPGEVLLSDALDVWPLGFHVRVPPEVNSVPGADADLFLFCSGAHILKWTEDETFPESLEQLTTGGTGGRTVRGVVPDEEAKIESPL
jgi:hypothetical protein